MNKFATQFSWFIKLTSHLWLLGLVMGLLSVPLTLAQGGTWNESTANASGLNSWLTRQSRLIVQSEPLAYATRGAVGPISSRMGSAPFDRVVPSGLTRTGEALLNTKAPVDCPSFVDLSGDTVLTEWETARFTASAEGESITYQWQQSTDGGASFSDLPGETNTTLSFYASKSLNGFQYRVIGSSPGCSAITSSARKLTVQTDCFIYLDDASGDVSVMEGEPARFEVNTFEPDVAYQWQQSTDGGAHFSDLPGETNGFLLEIQTSLSQNGYYYRLLASRPGCSPLTSPVRKLTVRVSCPSYVDVQGEWSVPEGWYTSFSAYTQAGNAAYQWQQSTDGTFFSDLPGQTSPDLSFEVTPNQDGTYYRVLVSSPGCPTLISPVHQLTLIYVCPRLVDISGDVSVVEGEQARFTASVEGESITYQWQQSTDGGTNFTDLPGQTLGFLDLQASLNQSGNFYRVLVSSPDCPSRPPLISPAARLSVSGCPTPSITTQPPSSSVVCPGTPVSALVVVDTHDLSAGMSYQWHKDGLVVAGATTTSLRLANAQPGDAGRYQLVITGSCSSLTSTAFSLQVSPAPRATLLASGPLSCWASQVTLTATGGGTYQFSPGAAPTGAGSTASVSTAGVFSVTVTAANGCSATSQQVVVDTSSPPTAPNLTSLTLVQGAPTLSLSASNCSGSLSWTGPNATAGSGPILLSTNAVGSFVYSASCTVGRCSSPATSLTVTVQPATAGLSVSHLDGDSRQLANNSIRPYLQVYNEGSSPIAYRQITLRYWLTAEDFSPLAANLSVNWAQLGASFVKMRYVPLGQQPRQGAYGYIEYRFEPTAGNLAAHSSSGPIQTSIAKNDWTAFSERDDYSYANASSYTKNPRITGYVNGQLVWGTEPKPTSPLTLGESLKLYSQTKSSPTTNTISTYVQLVNEGNTPIAYQNLKLRYWLTTDGGQFINYSLDYAQLGPGKVSGQLVRLPSTGQPVSASANAYLELSFKGMGRDSLYPASSTGLIQYRLTKSDWSNFEQSNDYSYQPMGALALNARMSAYWNGEKVFGSEPAGGSARQGAVEPTPGWQIRVLGNPVVGSQAEVEIAGAGGQPLTLRLLDGQGRLLGEQRIEEALPVQRVSVPLGESRGQLLLQVSTGSAQQSLKLVRP